jgi:ABC-type multidrug transport system fused ATPase/permease subunit
MFQPFLLGILRWIHTRGQKMKKLNAISKADWMLIKRAYGYVKPYKIKFLGAAILMIILVAIETVQPFLWAKLIAVLMNKDIGGMAFCIGAIAMIYILHTAIMLLKDYIFTFVNQSIINDFKNDIYKKILNLPIQAFDKMKSGEFLSRMNGDIPVIVNMLTNQFLSVVIDVLRVGIVGFLVFSINIPLACIVLLSFPISFLVFVIYGKKLRNKNGEFVQVNDKYLSSFHQSIIGIREIKSLGIKEKVFRYQEDMAMDLKNKSIGLSILNRICQIVAGGGNFLSEIAVLAVGGYFLLQNSITIEYFIAFSSYSKQFSTSLMNLTSINSNMQQAMVNLERIFHIVDGLSYQHERFGTKSLQPKGIIKFENLSFSYNKDKPVLKNVSFHVSPGKKLAIVGTSGSGKTTIFNLLLRFYEPDLGRILIDGTEISEFDENSLRSSISIVRQEPFLFNLTIKDNLRMASPNATDFEIEECCKKAYIYDYIMSLPEKFDTIVGENSVNLSVGQKQRISIARAFLKKSSIVLLDEATSALDNETQLYVGKAISELVKTSAVILITHRLSLITEHDEIMVLENGNIVGHGSHFSLSQNNPTYQKLLNREIEHVRVG